jgi:hypothetical protein
MKETFIGVLYSDSDANDWKMVNPYSLLTQFDEWFAWEVELHMDHGGSHEDMAYGIAFRLLF